MDQVNVKDRTKTDQLSDELIRFLQEIRQKVCKDNDNRQTWLKKLCTSSNQRLGIKRVSNRPYPGAPNIPLPMADKLIKKREANYVLAAFMPKEKADLQFCDGVRVTPELKEKLQRAKKGLNYVLSKKIDLLKVFTLATDYVLEKGHAIFKGVEKFNRYTVTKVYDLDEENPDLVEALRKLKDNELKLWVSEKYSLDEEDESDAKALDSFVEQFRAAVKKKNDRVISIDVEVIESFPDIIVPPPEKITPPIWATDIETCERWEHEYYLTKRQILERIKDGAFRKELEQPIRDGELKGSTKSRSENSFIESQKDRNEGITDEGDDELFKIQEINCWTEDERTKHWKRQVFVLLKDVSDPKRALCQWVDFPFEFSDWNIVKHDCETKDDRYYSSRGIPEQIRALQEFMEKAINHMIIRDEINNNPMFTVLSTSDIQQSTVRFIPGQKIKVKSHDELRKIDDISKVDISSERILSLLKAYAEEYQYSTDQLFRNATNAGGGKTLGEVERGVQLAAAPATLDVVRWFSTLKKIYTMVFNILKERVGDSIILADNDSATGYIEITKDDFDIPVEVFPNGNIDLADRITNEQKALRRMQLALSLPLEISTMDDKYNAAYAYYEASGVQNPDDFVTNPKETQAQQMQQLQAQQQVLAQEEADTENKIQVAQGKLNASMAMANQANAGMVANRGR